MAAPNLTIAVEPVEGGKAVYLPLAAKAKGEIAEFKLVLRLTLTNPGTCDLHVSGIRFAFPGSGFSAIDMQDIAAVLDPSGSLEPPTANGVVPAGSYSVWSNGVIPDTSDSNAVYLPQPAPPQVRVEVSCTGFSDPATITLDLVPYTSPTPAGALLFPIAASDLDLGSYPVTSAQHWANGGANGTQIFAHDVVVMGIDPDSGAWTSLKPGSPDKTKNDSYRGYGKKILAMADGTMLAIQDGIDDNAVAGSFPSPTPAITSGNSLWILHGDVAAVYCHFQKGTFPPGLAVGDPIGAGQELGRLGNSGNSSELHTHIEVRRSTTSGALRPIPFRGACVLDIEQFDHDNWVPLLAEGIPKDKVAVRLGPCLAVRPKRFFEYAIDPLALVLREDVYVRLTLPDPPPPDVLRVEAVALARSLSARARREAVARLDGFIRQAQTLRAALSAKPRAARAKRTTRAADSTARRRKRRR